MMPHSNATIPSPPVTSLHSVIKHAPGALLAAPSLLHPARQARSAAATQATCCWTLQAALHSSRSRALLPTQNSRGAPSTLAVAQQAPTSRAAVHKHTAASAAAQQQPLLLPPSGSGQGLSCSQHNRATRCRAEAAAAPAAARALDQSVVVGMRLSATTYVVLRTLNMCFPTTSTTGTTV
jgi:hypothetical protein